MAFKMKGSPMYRNFGIGKPSPNKQATISSVSDSLQNKPNPAIEKLMKELEETQDSTNNANSAELQRRANQIQQNVSPKEFNKQIEEHNEKNSPAKQGVRDPNKDYSDPEVLKKEREQNQAIYDQRTGKYKRDKKANKQMLRPRKKEEENVKSPSKQFEEGDYYDTRSKSPSKQFEEGDYYDTRSKSPNKQTISSVNDSLQNLPNPSAEKLRKEYEKALKKLQKEAQEKLNANSDSTNQSNSDVLNKRANQIKQNISPREYEKQVDEYNEKNSPNKQKHLGGTKSGKGNVFTKRGRTQRKINTERAETSKLTAEHIAKNKKATKLAVKAHKEKMIKKQLKNRPKTVVIQKQHEIKSNTTRNKDVTDQYR